jgi:hypothetical protein
MLKRIMTLLMAATLAGGFFAPDAQARGGGDGHQGVGGGHIGGVHGTHIPSEVRGPRMGSPSGRIRMSSDFAREIDSDRPHGARESCHPDCSALYGCRYLWQNYCL